MLLFGRDLADGMVNDFHNQIANGLRLVLHLWRSSDVFFNFGAVAVVVVVVLGEDNSLGLVLGCLIGGLLFGLGVDLAGDLASVVVVVGFVVYGGVVVAAADVIFLVDGVAVVIAALSATVTAATGAGAAGLFSGLYFVLCRRRLQRLLF